MRPILSAVAFAAVMITAAQAAPVTLGDVTFDSDNAATDVLWAQGGVFAGNLDNRREACIDFTDRNSTVGANGVNCRADEIVGYDPDLEDEIELDENNTVLQDPDVLAAFFDNPLVNGAGDDLILIETFNQNDSPTVTLILNGQQIFGTMLDVVQVNGKNYTIWGYDFNALGIAMGATIGEPIFLQTKRDDQNTPIGSSDLVAIIGLNMGAPPPAIPLPAAAPLFFAGLAGLGFAGRRRRKA